MVNTVDLRIVFDPLDNCVVQQQSTCVMKEQNFTFKYTLECKK
jgi:hypothetical protein